MSSTLLAGLEQELCGDVPFLGQLRLFQGRVRMVEIGAGILPVAVEKQGVEAPVEIVVMGDVALAGAFCVVLARAAAIRVRIFRRRLGGAARPRSPCVS